jgi:2-polyprenyl-3-methyl-5-hydroxy-6-metoxy-1,4-benzoquinol methylase
VENPLNYIYNKIEILNPLHGRKLRNNALSYDETYYNLAGAFFIKYIDVLKTENKTLDYSINCYLQMIADVNSETVEFIRTGKYTSTTFAEVNERVYANPGIMEYYMHGLIMSQFLWKHHYQMFHYFIHSLPGYIGEIKTYLEVGVGHGFYLSKALEILDAKTKIMAVDISITSIEMARRFVNDARVEYKLMDIFDFDEKERFDFITAGEILEHLEDPIQFLLKLNSLLSKNGVLFFTTPINAPAIDHISLFKNTDEIRGMIKEAGFEIVSESSFLSEDVSLEKAEKYKITILYGAFLRKISM